MKNICVIGAGHVGLVAGTCFADLGNRVVCVDIDKEKIALLQSGKTPFYEPRLQEMVARNVEAGRLGFTTSYPEGLKGAAYAFIAVDTPSGEEGEADLHYVQRAAEGIAEVMERPLIIVNQSTSPIGTGDWIADIVQSNLKEEIAFSVVSNPEFLREGTAIQDFLHPDRVVLGSTDREAADQVALLYEPLKIPILITDLRTAEMIKYASNAFLATRLSFINEIAFICDQLGADVKEVALGMGYDQRIGQSFLEAGLGWGGSCFPKDVRALAHMASIHGAHPQLLRAVMEINQDQRIRALQAMREMVGGSLEGKTIAVLGLSFKPDTDDMRQAPSVELIHLLQNEGAKIRAYDPVAMEPARRLMPEITYASDPYDAAEGADGLIVVTEWNEFKQLDMARVKESMSRPVLLDGRNIYDPGAMRRLGFDYRGIGRGRTGEFRGEQIEPEPAKEAAPAKAAGSQR